MAFLLPRYFGFLKQYASVSHNLFRKANLLKVGLLAYLCSSFYSSPLGVFEMNDTVCIRCLVLLYF